MDASGNPTQTFNPGAHQESPAHTIEVNVANVNEVLQQSVQTPVLLDFWADWCEPCKNIAPLLEKLVAEYQGKFILAKVNADENPEITQQLGVRGLPTLKLVVQGKLADELTGAQPEAAIRALLEPHIGQPEAATIDNEDALIAQIERAKQLRAYDQGIEALQQALQEDSDNGRYLDALVDLLLLAQRGDEAAEVAAGISDEKYRKMAQARVALFAELAQQPDMVIFQQRVQQSADDLEAHYYLGIHQLCQGNLETGMELLFQVMVQDRNFQQDAAKDALLKAFDLVGAGNASVSTYRRKVFALLH